MPSTCIRNYFQDTEKFQIPSSTVQYKSEILPNRHSVLFCYILFYLSRVLLSMSTDAHIYLKYTEHLF